ncbi:chloride channel protein [Micromonospora sp. NPDC048999]|uniref:chloride channel protein n=1 Tax=Micromonospora sp. NPDC048999 TaxID=3155391 RepID=UPI0033CD4C3F
MTAAAGDGRTHAAPADEYAPLRSRSYLGLLALAALLGVPIAAVAYWFLQLIALIQKWVYTDLPRGLGLGREPLWWPLVPLLLAGLVVGLTVRHLPGRGGESPAEGFHAGGVTRPDALPGVALAALTGIGLGVVIGPEAPLIALGGGLAYLVVWLRRRDVPERTGAAVAATGSFAAVSTLLGSPLAGAFLLLEASGLGGATAAAVLVPGLLAAGTGSLIFLGLDSLTGHGTFSLAIPHLPPAHRPTVAQFLWALAIGLVAGVLCWALRRLALLLRAQVERQVVVLTTLAGAVIAALAIGYAAVTGKSSSDLLFSGQFSLPQLLTDSAAYSVPALVLLVIGKGIAYCLALSAFRGGPTFPAMFIGAAGGIALSHLPGLPLVSAAGMGIGAMIAGMLKLPLSAVLLTTLFLGAEGLTVLPLVIVSAVVAYVLSVRLTPPASAARGSHAPPQEAKPAT